MTLPAPDAWLEQAEIALEDKAWSCQDAHRVANLLIQASSKHSEYVSEILTHQISDGKMSAKAKIDLPKYRNHEASFRLEVNALVIDGCGASGLKQILELSMDNDQLRKLGLFLVKVSGKYDDLPED